MPYIPAVDREPLLNDPWVAPGSVGQLNFCVTSLVVRWLGARPGYADYNAAIGALECAKLELYRRMVAPYEDGKRAVNGDVYPDSVDTYARARKEKT